MKKSLCISDTLSLPLDYATSRNMVLAQSGAGKSNVCVVLAEEMHRNGIPWITIDTKGDWYGVRSSRDGKSRGLDIPVFGGEFGDIPLSPLAGARMAELVAAGKISGVFDVSDFPKTSDVSRFLTDFANTLLKKQRTPVHLFLEECHDYLPQGGYRGQIDPLAAACVGAMKRLATKGRFRGIGYTLISQRAAEVNKTVLYQCETLIALRMIGDLDIKWIEGWVKRGSARAPELLSTLHELGDGECWIWSPQRLKVIERVQARLRETFDSGAAPKIGKARVVPKMAPVEIEALRKELADLEAQAKADDPKELKKRIAELEKELSKQSVKKIEVPAIPESTVKRLERVETDLGTGVGKLARVAEAAIALTDQLKTIGRWQKLANAAGDAGLIAATQFKLGEAKRNGTAIRHPVPVSLADGKRRVSAKQNGASVSGGLRRMMIALAQRPQGLTSRQLGLRAGLSSKSGTFSTYLSRGRSEGWITDEGNVRKITDAGLSELGSYDPLPEGRALLEYWLNGLGGGASRMLSALSEVYPKSLTSEELGKLAGISHRSGTFSTYLSRMRTLELVEGRGDLRMSEELS